MKLDQALLKIVDKPIFKSVIRVLVAFLIKFRDKLIVVLTVFSGPKQVKKLYKLFFVPVCPNSFLVNLEISHLLLGQTSDDFSEFVHFFAI
ncbi:MAG: hypothetical protein R3B47_11730 [Bacteroidia bacterium]